MKIAIIPARGGSKRIPRKNIKSFGGKPMIAYAITAAQKSGLFAHVLVSTDDHEIAEIANALGAETPFFRPAELANDYDEAPTVIATGGLAPLIIGVAETIDEYEPDLTLIGLRLIHEKNQ